MLDIHGVGIGEDIVHLVRGLDDGELRNLIDSAFRNEAPPMREFPVRESSGTVEKWLRIACSPDRVALGMRSEVVAVLIVDVTLDVRRRRELEETVATTGVRITELSLHVDDLDHRHRALLIANDELTTANNDLRNANERLLISSEEAASANEEIETLNEEMQATNEELETLNEELQATVEELNTTNDELESRGAELERIAVARESDLRRVDAERLALGRALDAVGGPIAVLAPDGTPVYVSAGVGGRAALPDVATGWWRSPTVTLAGIAYESKIASNGEGGITVVTLRKVQ
jgi:two-component system CheB/CheR fusion protein